jgi:hypothetical protein
VKDIHELGGTFEAEVRGRDVATGNEVELQGRVLGHEFDTSEQVASLTVEGEGDGVSVGGLVAALEDVEAQEIVLDRP